MNDLTRWQQNNDAYLAAALAWLRLRLERLAPGDQNADKPIMSEPALPSLLDRLLGRSPTEPASDVPALPPASSAALDDAHIARAAEAMAAAETVEPPPALLILSRQFGLSRFERDVLLLCAAIELDTRMASLCARAQADPHRPYPTFALALALFDDPAWDALSPERPLRYWRMIEINQPGAQPLTASALRADERIVNMLKGLNYLDDRLSIYLTPLDVSATARVAPTDALPRSQRDAAETIVRHLHSAAAEHTTPVVQLVGPDSGSKQLVAGQAAAELGLHLYRLPAGLLPGQAADLETFARLWQRESILLPIALYLDAHELDGGAPAEGQASSLNRFVSRCDTLIFLDTRDVWPSLDRPGVTIDISRPTPTEQQAAWAEALSLPGVDGPAPSAVEGSAQLAGQFNLNLPEIRQIARLVRAEASTNGSSLHERAWRACLMRTRPRLDALAQRIDAKATWDDIVLPDAEMELLRQIASQVGQRSKVYDEWGFRRKMNRGLGISALFAGESGTGKTMAAEVIANDLRLNLYRIDLSAVVSKYIGETEKNLRRLFDAAEDGGAILFFDEADALFGKRSEVKDSHDRYANIEINYLLQRMEAYRGLAILATNMKSALDAAFVRRLRFIVNFPFPGPDERRRIWQRAFPPEMPVHELDFDRLARLNLTGGSIHNVAINAAFRAAQAGSPVTMPVLSGAARAEFRKLEQPISEAEFR